MSQHYFTTNDGRKVLYGLDKPTGGFFFTEFWKDEEIADDEVKNSKDALTLTELVDFCNKEYNNLIDIESLTGEWSSDEDPSPMQYQVNKMFGKDLKAMLNRVVVDLTEHRVQIK